MNFMKITKSRLKEIIIEELKRVTESTDVKVGDSVTLKNNKKAKVVKLGGKGKGFPMNMVKVKTSSGKEEVVLVGDLKERVEINEGLSDLEFVIDQLANSMEHYDEKEFIKHISSQTKYKAPQLKKIFQSYWKLGAMERHNMFLSGDPKPWLKKLGVK